MGWSHCDLFDAGAPKAFTVPHAYTFDARGTQHVVYIGQADNHVWEVSWENDVWSPNDLTSLSGAPPQPAGNPINRPTGYVFSSQGTRHVVYTDSSGCIHELWHDNSGWHHHDLTTDIGAPLSIVLPPCAYVFDSQGTQHVDYIGSDGCVNELWWDHDGWHHNNLTNASGAPLALLPNATAPKGYIFEGTQHVVYLAQDGNLHELFWQNFSWGHSPVTAIPRDAAPALGGSLAAYTFAPQGSQHVDYIGANGGIFEVSNDNSGAHFDDLISEAGPTTEAPTVMCAYPFDAQGTRHVDFTGGTGHVIELWHDANGWHHNDLTLASGGAPPADQGDPAGYAFAAQGTQHVYYIGIDDNHIHELRWQPITRPILPVPSPLASR